MADFKTHLVGAAVFSGITATSLLLAGVASNNAVAGYFVLGVVGGLLPDIDSDTSIPLRVTFTVLAVVAGFLVVFDFAPRYSLLELFIMGLACFFGIRYGVFSLFTRMTVHRGLIHSIPAGVVFGLLTTLLFHYAFDASSLHAWTCGVFVFFGFLVHLLLDEIYSVNLMGMQFKRSFGSAFNLGSLGNLYGTVALYLVILGLLYLCPPSDGFVNVMVNSKTYDNLLERVLPTQGWFNGLVAALGNRIVSP